ncbi:MAG: DUF1553 domain-containing protein [Algoriphagus sp.]|uniref:DUF1553 domain-containing protein n=1 Tax=Algoriphagus sp. TaxID=1872435 RepID=UPI0026291A20|nr:DUF1553 domain-containing protein [Algoriphagus sp.]MDG1277692.1 DUF1553 domain-containing protein [Algoriphagus sp.]
MTRERIAILLSVLLGVSLLFFFWKEEEKIDFSTQIKPILNTHCITCHGGVKKNGEFSLLFEEEAFAPTKSGHPAIIPGDPNGSELIRRLTESDPELRMPYQKSPLSEEEIELLKTWIRQGAKWGEHWAYSPVAEPNLPASPSTASLGNNNEPIPLKPIDYYVREKLEELNLQPSEQADISQLIRRAALDITGLPPSQELIQSIQSGKISYDTAVDQLLASPSFGEKWASWWLDLARYADTKGYERDVSRTMWPYRDWVIRAFNSDKPFDEFTIEQLAGDLLHNPTTDQLAATAFHRNTMNNDEGGTNDEEFRVAAVLDRVSTTYEVWQSTTMACVQCHSHPYDPIRHEEFYQSTAFFNNSRDEDTHDEEPKLRFYESEDQERLNEIVNWVSENQDDEEADKFKKFLTYQEPKYAAHIAQDFIKSELIDTKWLGMQADGSCYLRDIDTQEADQLLLNYWSDVDGSTLTIRKDGPEGDILSTIPINKSAKATRTISFPKLSGKHDLYLEMKSPKAKTEQNAIAVVWFAFLPSLPGKEKNGFEKVQNNWENLIAAKTTTVPILIENPSFMSRETHVFERGNWMILGEKVSPEIPKSLNPSEKKWRQDRLGFAEWLVDNQNPLTARTLVNRIWDQLFGRGIVSTLEDMGTQSDPPSHPELLDYLAWRVMNEYDWSIKELIREIVTSETYKQKSVLSPELFAADPQNKWYARGPRIRLSAEQVRDQALAVSGLLSSKMFGKPVMPPQPEGIWQTVYNGESWVEAEGEDRYRRGIYTFLKRTSPYPSMVTFDAGSREVCLSRRIVTNTPLQALVTLNDPVFLEASFHLAKEMMESNPADPKSAISYGYSKLVLSQISKNTSEAMMSLYKQGLSEYQTRPELLEKFFGFKNQIVTPELAAMSLVANAFLNLDEFLTKP